MSLSLSSTHEWISRRLTGEGVLSGVDALHDPFSLFLVQCIIILTICRLLGLLGAGLNQPKVIFEIIGGILLGPSAIGRNTQYLNTIFPTSSLKLIEVVANLGLVLYLFIVGMELDPKLLATHASKAGAIAFLGMAVPFALGIAISQTMFDVLQKSDPAYANVSFISFFVFIGTAMSITAFPVLARILKEGGLIYTTAGSMAMGAAALNDAAAWCLLVLAISLANSANLGTAGYVFLSVLVFAVILLFGFRPIWRIIVEYVESKNSPSLSNGLFCLTLILVFLCAWTTALLGLDSIFGAFLFGLIMPRESNLFKECNEKIEELVLSLTLPLYFALSGLKTDVTQINTAGQGAMVVLVCVIATIGKYFGVGIAAYFGGMSVRESSVIAALMNTRGLVELIVLNLGRSAGILSIKTFSVMVIMCLVTTFMTCPVVNCIYPVHLRILANEELKAKPDIETGDSNYHGDVEDSKQEDGETSAMVAKGARLCVIVDRMEHLQGLMDLLSCFIPYTSNSKLAVIAIRVFEPSMSERDRFIGLNTEGRLINVEEESTTLHDQGAAPYTQNQKLAVQELLPLSMFLRAVGGTVKSYRMRGDPKEFPHEIRALTNKKCNLILLPWRVSQYLERLFWHSLRTVSSPIALIVVLDTTLSPTKADLATGGASGSERGEQRARSQSVNFGRSRAVSTADVDIDCIDGLPGIKSETLGSSSPSTSPVLSLRRMSSMVDGGNADDIIPAADRQSVCVQTVLVVITGSATCCTAFPLALRFADRKSTEVTVLVTSDRRSYPEPLKEVLAAFRHSAQDISNITIKILTTPSKDIDAIIAECSESMYDLVIFGHSVTATDDCQEDSSPVPHSRPHRSASITFSPSIMDIPELRRQSGVPEYLTNSPLAHPELGLLGNRIRERGLASFLMVLHEPICMGRNRVNTTWGGITPVISSNSQTSDSASPQHDKAQSFKKTKELSPIKEEAI